jgi:hypothetical protein
LILVELQPVQTHQVRVFIYPVFGAARVGGIPDAAQLYASLSFVELVVIFKGDIRGQRLVEVNYSSQLTCRLFCKAGRVKNYQRKRVN